MELDGLGSELLLRVALGGLVNLHLLILHSEK